MRRAFLHDLFEECLGRRMDQGRGVRSQRCFYVSMHPLTLSSHSFTPTVFAFWLFIVGFGLTVAFIKWDWRG